jgi:hypothetical protein
MAEVWKKDIFQADGLTLFFRLLQDRMQVAARWIAA